METIGDSRGARELDRRSADGIDVTLLWEASTDGVVVTVVDERTGERFAIQVDPAHALDAFRHPYAYDRRHDDTAEAAELTRYDQTR